MFVNTDNVSAKINHVSHVFCKFWRNMGTTQQLPRAKNCTKDVTFDKIIADNLKVLDLTSVAMCREYGMPVEVYSKDEPNGIIRLLSGEKFGTIIHK